jgi:hypothetical protein
VSSFCLLGGLDGPGTHMQQQWFRAGNPKRASSTVHANCCDEVDVGEHAILLRCKAFASSSTRATATS